MKITVLGARGQVGRRVVEEALRRGHHVSAVVRRADQASSVPAAATTLIADAAVSEQVARVASGQDVVINATRPRPGFDEETVATTRAIIEGAARAEARLVVAGGAAVLRVPGRGERRVLDDPEFLPPEYRAIGEASCLQFEVCLAEKSADWVYVCPPAELSAGVRTGRYRLGEQTLLLDAAGRSAISMEDLAVALLDEIEQPRHQRTFFTVAAAP